MSIENGTTGGPGRGGCSAQRSTHLARCGPNGVKPRSCYRTKWDQDRVRDWVPSLVWDEMGPRQGQGLGAKAGIGRTEARTGSGIGPNRARTKLGTGYQGGYLTKWGQDRVREWGTKPGIGRNRGRTGSGGGYKIIPTPFFVRNLMGVLISLTKHCPWRRI